MCGALGVTIPYVSTELSQVVVTVLGLSAKRDDQLGSILQVQRKPGPVPANKLILVHSPSKRPKGRPASAVPPLLLYVRSLLMLDFSFELSKANRSLAHLLENSNIERFPRDRSRLARRLSTELDRWQPEVLASATK